MNNQNSKSNEDYIDYKLIWLLLYNSKLFIIAFSLIFAFITAIYLAVNSYDDGPINISSYTSSAEILIGSYKNKGMDCMPENDIRDDASGYRCKREKYSDQFSTINEFSDLKVLVKNTFPDINNSKINLTYKGNHLFKIDVHSSSKKNAEDKMLEIIAFTLNHHKLLMEKVKNKRDNDSKSYRDTYNLELMKIEKKLIELKMLKEILVDKTRVLKSFISSNENHNERKIHEIEALLVKKQIDILEPEISNLAHLAKNSMKFEIHGTRLQALYQLFIDNKDLLSEDNYIDTSVVEGISTVEKITTFESKESQLVGKNFILGFILSIMIVLFRSRKKIF
jgi:hypothetical protein